MLDRIRALILGETAPGGDAPDALQVAAAALLAEAALLDDSFEPAERAKIAELLERRFGLKADEARALLAEGERRASETAQLLGFTRVLKDNLNHEERVDLIEMLWEVVYADGRLHHFEANLLRRLAGLLFVSDRESGEARKRALARLGLER